MFFTDAKTQMEQLKAKRSVSGDGINEEETEKLLPFYVNMMTELAHCERCSVFIHDPVHDQVWLKAGTGLGERDIEIIKEGSVVGDVIISGKPKIINKLESKSGAHKQADIKTGFTTQNILCVPIKSDTQNQISGAFQLLNKYDNQDFTNEDLVLAEVVSGHLQKEIDAIYLGQETFKFTERLYTSFIWVGMGLIIFFVLAVISSLALLGALLA